MEIKINVIEAASELAHEDVLKNFDHNSDQIYENIDEDCTEYTEEAQDVFNKFYDYYFEIISGCSVEE